MAMALTLLRFVLIIPFGWCFFTDASWSMLAAFWLFVIAAITDFLDGYVARSRGEESALGAALDPLADKLLMVAALVLMIDAGQIEGIAVIGALVILLREVLVTGLREALAPSGVTLPVTRLAKIKTTVQLIAIAALLACAPGSLLPIAFLPAAWTAFWIAVALTIITGAEYSLKAIKAL